MENSTPQERREKKENNLAWQTRVAKKGTVPNKKGSTGSY